MSINGSGSFVSFETINRRMTIKYISGLIYPNIIASPMKNAKLNLVLEDEDVIISNIFLIIDFEFRFDF